MRIAWSIKIPMVRPSLVLTAILSIIGTLQLLAEPQVFRIVQLRGDQHLHAEHDDLRHRPRSRTSASPPRFSVVLALATFVLSFTFLRITRRKADA